MLSGIAAFGLAAAALPIGVSASSAASGVAAVKTAAGPVRGIDRDGVVQFLGIPYAAPPVGALRWRPPQPAAAWRKLLDASRMASSCPQVTTLGTFSGANGMSEDCLYLNVYAPRSASAAKKPVIVWIHGGANIAGGAADYDGTWLAKGGTGGSETVVVTFNYRLGVLGFLSTGAINAEGHPGNYGLLDQQALLRWVKQNIAAFGGDPDNVTIAGQSNGSLNVGAHLLSPQSAGLFHRAIMQSSPMFIDTIANAGRALTAGDAFTAAAGCAGPNAGDCLRGLSAARVLQLQGTPAATAPAYLPIGVFVDGTIIPMDAPTAFGAGKFNKVPVLGGSTRDEWTFLTGSREYYSGFPQTPMTAQQYGYATAEGTPIPFGGKMPAETATRYALANFGNDPMIAYARIVTDRTKCAELHTLSRLAAHVPTYAYDFTYQQAPYYFPAMAGFKPLAGHGVDLQFYFGGWHGGQWGVNLDQATGMPRELNAKELELSGRLIATWTRFAKTGNPNAAGSTQWPAFAPAGAAMASYFVQDLIAAAKPAASVYKDYNCDIWDAQLADK